VQDALYRCQDGECHDYRCHRTVAALSDQDGNTDDNKRQDDEYDCKWVFWHDYRPFCLIDSREQRAKGLAIYAQQLIKTNDFMPG
jgi:hypothetical protein